jgi:general secretion pathway protein J
VASRSPPRANACARSSLAARQLAGALRTPLEVPDPTREPIFFQGEEQRMLFAADLPGYLGRGGAYLHALQVDGRSGQQRLLLDLVLLQEGERIAEIRRARRRCWWRT